MSTEKVQIIADILARAILRLEGVLVPQLTD